MEIQEVTLGEISTITMGTSPKGETYNYEGVGMPLLNGPTEFGLIHPKCTLFTTDSKKDSKKGDLIFCVRGSTTGRMNWADMPYSLGRGVCSIRGATPMDTKYIKYYLENKLDALLKLSGGATFPNLTGNDFATFPIHYQKNRHKIAAILSAYDDLIENNTRRIKILEEMAQALYREWFVKFRFPGHEKVKMVESEMGMVPEGWEVKKLKDICSLINYGYTASAQKDSIGPKFLRITDIVPYLIDWDSVPYCGITEEKLIKYKLEEGDIVIARTGATTGYAKRINKNHPETVFASYLVRIRISPEFSNRLFGLIIESEEYKNFIKSNLGGAAQPQANAQILTSKPILVPSKGIQISFDKIISDFMDNRGVLQKKNINLRRTRDLLLPKLISGEVDVQDLKIINGVSNGRS